MPRVERAVVAALQEEVAPEGAEVSVVLTTDEEIADYHQRFMGIPGPTDVISWPADVYDPTGEQYLGDVMVSCETGCAQAAELGHSWEREVCVLAVHGTLHLLGWDDQTECDRQAMQTRVDELVTQALVG